MRIRWPLQAALAGGAMLVSPDALGGSFDGHGQYLPDPAAVASLDFGADFDPDADRYLPPKTPGVCLVWGFIQKQGPDALDGTDYLHLQTYLEEGCTERFLVDLPAVQGSYVARLWMRHGSIDAQMTVLYPESSGLQTMAAKLAPTGRVTSDGWVELRTNEFPVDGALAEKVFLRVYDVDSIGSDIDALEIAAAGEFWQQQSCSGTSDPVCGQGAVCLHNDCQLGRLHVPPLPDDDVRDEMVDVMQSQLRVFFGGRKTRLENLPAALSQLDSIRYAPTAWAFWNGWAIAMGLLQDWHTEAYGPISRIERRARLNVCFIEGDADASAGTWPKHPQYRDLLVSHTGLSATQGISQGDRLVAVDGQHPIEWALGLSDVRWSLWRANDNQVYSELAEHMRGMILAHATSFSILRCSSITGTCNDVPDTLLVAELPDDTQDQVRCDNRPFYPFSVSSNPSLDHNVGYSFFQGRIANTTQEEEIYGLLWDTLYGGGDPNGWVNKHLKDAFADFKQQARGVILDHRAGNGGTLDAAEVTTTLVRPVETLLVFPSPIEFGGFDGPETPAEGIALFEKYETIYPMVVGSTGHDPDLPVALLLHRDGSASDFMPFGMKGAPNVKIFAQGPTAGAFSTYYQYVYWGGISWRMASGDSIAYDGRALIGHGVEPDVVVEQKQSDLLAGKDTVHEAGLAWVRQNLKP